MPAHIREQTPRAHGFYFPAEWTPHQSTWAAWPFNDENWRGQLDAARVEYADFMRTLASREPVNLLLGSDEALSDATARLSDLPPIRFLRVDLDDVWLRDSGPIFVVRPDGQVSFVHWDFNAWGRKFEWARDDHVPEAIADTLGLDHFDVAVVLEGGSLDTNGRGAVLTTRQCLLHPARNPELDDRAIETLLHDNLACDTVIWLDQGLEGDHTDGHVDTLARFVDERTIVACTTKDRSDPNYDVLKANLEILRAARDRDDRPFTVVELLLPSERREFGRERLPQTYANFYIVNGAVIVPQYGDPHDASALDVLRPLFGGREVIGCASSAIITGGGSFHCLTQQQPSGPLWRHG